eukprot:NODE_165_length_14629_cov_0.605231.p6 type:complete len:232 gc:universal NODE_165_length_14629_cov_0.605231:6389-5694(-)
MSSESESGTSDSDSIYGKKYSPIQYVKPNKNLKLPNEYIKSIVDDDNVDFLIHHEKLQNNTKLTSLKSDEYQIKSVDDTDNEDALLEVENWKIRELERLIRDKEERMAYDNLCKEIESFRSLPEHERNEIYTKRLFEQAKTKNTLLKPNYLQKHYHKGAFYLDGLNQIINRDYNEATGLDKMDKSDLPQILQVKNFGKKGQSKWTHLKNEDTFKDAEAWGDEAINSIYIRK